MVTMFLTETRWGESLCGVYFFGHHFKINVTAVREVKVETRDPGTQPRGAKESICSLCDSYFRVESRSDHSIGLSWPGSEAVCKIMYWYVVYRVHKMIKFRLPVRPEDQSNIFFFPPLAALMMREGTCMISQSPPAAACCTRSRAL